MPGREPAVEDAFDAVLRPPPDETAEERSVRLAREDHARRVSEAIDEDIKKDRARQKKRKPVRVLLLGQSESGKSTTLRQFQRLYTPTAFREERTLWRSVIQLNLVRSVRTILEAVADVRRGTLPAAQRGQQPLSDDDSDSGDTTFNSGTAPALAPTSPTAYNGYGQGVVGNLDAIQHRLAPLRRAEALLIAYLVAPNETEPTRLALGPGPSGATALRNSSSSSGLGSGSGYQDPPSLPSPPSFASTSNGAGGGGGGGGGHRNQEIFVRPGTGWKGFIDKARTRLGTAPGVAIGAEFDDVTEILHQCRHDIRALWADEGVREILRRRKLRLEESPGFFLNDLDRVAALTYEPTDDDVLRARLKTVGVSEYTFEMESAAGRESGAEWRIIDVGGSRSQRPTWVPFFDTVDAIIFLAPISGFDQVLVEDRSVNRLEDSVVLWKAVCSNKLLAGVDLVLFLNKCDIMERKLTSGIRLAKYVRSFGDRPNDLETASKYFRSKFSAIQREYSPSPRKFYGFCTSVTDTTTTSGILASVRDTVIRQHLKQSKLLPIP